MAKYRSTGLVNRAECFLSALVRTAESHMQEGLVIRARLTALSSFLKYVREKFYSASKKPSDRAPTADLHTLARFIFGHSQYSSTYSRPKPAAFLPARNKSVISMQFIDGFQETEIWDVGDIIGRERDKTALARADLPKSVALDVGLTVELAPGPHPLHADVGGWPPDKDKPEINCDRTLCKIHTVSAPSHFVVVYPKCRDNSSQPKGAAVK